MSEMDSTPVPGEQNANSAASGATVQPNSFDPEKFARELTARVMAAVNDPKVIQSQKDRVIAEVKKDKGLKDLWQEVKTLKAEGLSDAEIEREIRIRDLESRAVEQPAAAPQSFGKVVAPQTNDTVKAVISALGLDMNAPEVVDVLSSGKPMDEQIRAFTSIQASQSKPANPAAVAQPAGGSIPPVNPELLAAQYKQEVMAKRGDKAAIKIIQQKYAAQGLDVGGVSFSV